MVKAVFKNHKLIFIPGIVKWWWVNCDFVVWKAVK